MSQFNYEDYEAASKESRKNGSSREESPVKFLNALLKNDGDSVIVRFPYHSMSDVVLESCHSVMFPGDKWNKRVRCMEINCPLCNVGTKIEMRFFVKMLVYTTDGKGGVDISAAVWDRPAAFAAIDLKNLIQDYGDLTEQLFKIKRNGTGLDTRYTPSIVTNKAVYNPEAYAPCFEILKDIDATRILTKPMNKYLEAVGLAVPLEALEEIKTPSTARTKEEKESSPAEKVLSEDKDTKRGPTIVKVAPTSTFGESNGEVRAPRRYTF